MDIEDAIVRSIKELTDEKKLNAINIIRNGMNIQWNSFLGSLGKIQYNVSFAEFENNIESGMRYVSILIAFTELITKDENKAMIENIKEANRRGSRTLFLVNQSADNIVNMYAPMITNPFSWTSIPIKFRESSDGEYDWVIPNEAEIYACLNDSTIEDCDFDECELTRRVSEYTGLQSGVSSGIPVLAATQSARGYSDYEPDKMNYPVLGMKNPSMDYIP